MFIFLLKLNNYSNDLVFQLNRIFYTIIYELKYSVKENMYITV